MLANPDPSLEVLVVLTLSSYPPRAETDTRRGNRENTPRPRSLPEEPSDVVPAPPTDSPSAHANCGARQAAAITAPRRQPARALKYLMIWVSNYRLTAGARFWILRVIPSRKCGNIFFDSAAVSAGKIIVLYTDSEMALISEQGQPNTVSSWRAQPPGFGWSRPERRNIWLPRQANGRPWCQGFRTRPHW